MIELPDNAAPSAAKTSDRVVELNYADPAVGREAAKVFRRYRTRSVMLLATTFWVASGVSGAIWMAMTAEDPWFMWLLGFFVIFIAPFIMTLGPALLVATVLSTRGRDRALPRNILPALLGGALFTAIVANLWYFGPSRGQWAMLVRAWIPFLVLPPVLAECIYRIARAGARYYCHRCGEDLHGWVQHCGRCGTELTPPDAAKSPAP